MNIFCHFLGFLENEQIIIVVNNSKKLQEVTIPVWRAEVPEKGKMYRLMYTYDRGYTTEYEEYLVEDGEVVLIMGRYSAAVLKTKDPGNRAVCYCRRIRS